MAFVRSFALLAGLLFVAGCGGSVETGPANGSADQDGATQPGDDASLFPDAAPESSVVYPDSSIADKATIDVTPGEFCSGEAKVRFQGQTLTAPLTTSLVIMDCCDGAVVRFHTKPSLGFNIEVTLRTMAPMPTGEYVIGDEPGGMEVNVGAAGEWGSSAPAKGTLHIDKSYPDPVQLGFCLETEADTALGAMKLYVPNVLVAPYDWEKRFQIYLLEDPAISADDALQMPIDSLKLSFQPIVTLMSLAWYEQSTHSAYWDSWYSTDWLISQLPKVGVHGLPFVVEADGQRIYVGGFMTMISSVMLNAPTIMVESMTKEGFTIAPPPSGPDPRSDPRILQALSESTKLAP
ncbi:MAG: hypothetical protein HY898_14745 [Deltaproteobacteria bacterium]|nr:hypothetical protein [Deltaproteobacteria bacterium]